MGGDEWLVRDSPPFRTLCPSPPVETCQDAKKRAICQEEEGELSSLPDWWTTEQGGGTGRCTQLLPTNFEFLFIRGAKKLRLSLGVDFPVTEMLSQNKTEVGGNVT